MLEDLLVILLEALSQVEGEIVLDIVGELLPELGVELEDLEEVGDVETLEEAVGERTDICAGLDNTGGTGLRGGEGRANQGNVTSNQISFS